MFAQHLKNQNLDQTPSKKSRVKAQRYKGGITANSEQNINKKVKSVTITNPRERIVYLDSHLYQDTYPQQQNNIVRASSNSPLSQKCNIISSATQQLSNIKSQHMHNTQSKVKNSTEQVSHMHKQQMSIVSPTAQKTQIQIQTQTQTQTPFLSSHPFISQTTTTTFIGQQSYKTQNDQIKKCDAYNSKDNLPTQIRPHHRKQDSLMGSVCEFTDNQESNMKIPPKMQMQASKMQSSLFRNNKVNQQFFAINKDTGEIFDLRNPDSATHLTQNAIKAEHLKKNKLPWEEWWKQKKQNNIDFLLASQQNDFIKCSELLQDYKGDLKAEPNFCDQQTGWAPLHFACLNCNIQLVNKLIVNEANLNQETVNQVTPLMIAAEQGSEEIVILLIKAGAEINLQDENGNTALHIACMQNKYAIIDIFLNRFKPDISIKNKIGKRCFDFSKTDQAKKYFDDYISKVSSLILKINPLNSINQTNITANQVSPSANSQIILVGGEGASKILALPKVRSSLALEQTDKQQQRGILTEQSLNLVQQHNATKNENQKSVQSPSNKQERQQKSEKSEKISKQNITIQLIQPKRISTSHQNIPNGDILSPHPKTQIEHNPSKNISYQKSPSSQISTNKLSSIKNAIPRSRDHSKNESFFNKKGYFTQGKENIPTKKELSKKSKQVSRPMSTNNPQSLCNIPIQESISTTNTTAANTIANISQCGSSKNSSQCGSSKSNSQCGSSKNNSIQSNESIQTQPKTTNQSSQSKITIHSFIIHSMLGKGSFGDVYLVQKKCNLQFYAMKVLQKNKMMKSNVIKYALTERNVLSITNHPFIVKLNYSFQTEEKLFLILDFAAAGDMGKLLQKIKIMNENSARIYLSEILLALEDLHKRDIIFRDLKPDNIVIDSEGHALLTDFGLSKEGVFDYTEGAKSFCGSIAYLAPEMLKRRGHGKAVDWYLFGVVMYEMLTGNPPYYANNKEDLFLNIQNATLSFPNHISQEAKSLLTALLERNPAMRLGCGRSDANEIKNHPFFKDVDWVAVYDKKIKPPEIQLLQLHLNNYNSDQFIENLIGNSVDNDNANNEKYISGWSFIANNKDNLI